MTPEQSDNLDWLAFQYIVDELDEAERERFEQRLADDAEACEAVARAVEMTQAVVAAQQQVEGSDRQVGRLRRIAWTAAAVAASLSLVLAYQMVHHPVDSTSPGITSPTQGALEDQGQLAAAWISMMNEFIFAADAELLETEVGTDSDLALLDDAAEDHGTATPDWMLAAVSGLNRPAVDLMDGTPSAEN